MNQMKFLSAKQNREIEKYAITKGINLIDFASSEIAKFIISKFTTKEKILFIIGSGNNGGDGLAAAIKLYINGYNIDVYRIFPNANDDNQLYYREFSKYKTPLLNIPDIGAYDIVVDGIFGIGLDRNIEGITLETIEAINNKSKYTISIDVPSGLGAFNAKVYGKAIYANDTITFLADKQGLHTSSGLDHAGNVTVFELIDNSNIKLSKPLYKVYKNNIKDINLDNILRKKKNTNKGTYGSLAIIGGNIGMHGALQLAGTSALYSGCGKVSLVPLDYEFMLDIATPELMVKNLSDYIDKINSFSALVVGIGFDTHEESQIILEKLINNIKQPSIFDADSLNIIAGNILIKEQFIKLKNKIITPHPTEAARLLNSSVEDIQNDRFNAIQELGKIYKATVILKGAGSLIYHKNIVYINNTGNQGMAVAGQGDVLSGIIGSFLAQGLNELSSSKLATYVHGLTGDNLVKELGGYIGVLPNLVAKGVGKELNKLI
jgi:hydroxyethylthiazole kinase-like uncharacterized protein yjeF